jgi:hypothetical protein
MGVNANLIALKQVTCSNAVVATPSVLFTYDTNYNRMATMTDGVGTTTYNYYNVASGQLGAGQLSSVSNSFIGASSVIAYNYDELVHANHSTHGAKKNKRWDSFSATNATQGSKARLRQLNIQTPCPPRGAVPVNQGRAWEAISFCPFRIELRSWMRLSGKKYWADGTPIAGQQFTYNFDDIGNRKTTASGGDSSGANLRSANYTNNVLNQIIGRDVPGYVSVLGSANPNATVTVNLQRAYRYGSYFQDELAVANTSAALYLSLTNLAVLNNGTNADIVATNTGNVFLAQTPEIFGYDADGNTTNDGRFTYTWDAENRLVNMTSLMAKS